MGAPLTLKLAKQLFTLCGDFIKGNAAAVEAAKPPKSRQVIANLQKDLDWHKHFRQQHADTSTYPPYVAKILAERNKDKTSTAIVLLKK